MEATNGKLSISLAVVGILTWVFIKVVNWMWLKPKKLERCLREQGFTGNPYTLLYGDLKEMSITSKEALSKTIKLSHDIGPRVHHFVHQLINHYGKKSFIWIGPTPRVIIMNPELIRDVFMKINDFQRPVTNPLVKLVANGLVLSEGEQWVEHRKILNPAFHLEKLKHMVSEVHQTCNEVISEWEKMVSSEGLSEVDVWPFLETLSGDVISRTAFGSSYMEGKKIFQLQTEQSHLVIQALSSVYIPGWRFLPTKLNKRLKQIKREVEDSLKGIINKREKAMKAGELVANDDLLGILMESNYREIQEHGNKKNIGMSIKEVIEECKLFYLAGQGTTSVLLVWTMILLSKHQSWQTRAREEVLQVFGNDKPHFEGLNQLKIVTMIFYEVLRLYPPVIFLNRTLHKDTKLGELVLPAGVELTLPTVCVHHDCELWGDDAKEFKPERFSDGVSKATKNRSVSFFPFGYGPRICIGQNFAMIESKIALAMILQRFSFDISPSYAHAPILILTLQPQFGAHLILHKL